jgi:hypothetical protein
MNSTDVPWYGATTRRVASHAYPTTVLAVLLIATCIPRTQATPIHPPARDILAGARRHIPADETWIRGDLRIKASKSRPAGKLQIEIAVTRRADTTTVEYTVSDVFGQPIERFVVTRTDSGDVDYRHAQGSETARNIRRSSTRIQNADVSWIDMSLDFLWWNDPVWIREDSVKGHACHVLDVPAPELDEAGYSMVRLWLEKKSHALLRADAYGANGDLARQFSVRSLKKIDGRWMIKSLDFFTYPMRDRTRLHVREVRAMGVDDADNDAARDRD